MYLDITLLAGCALLFSFFAGRMERSWLTGPIIFTGFGFLIGPLVFDILSFQAKPETIKLLAELTLAIVLFTDASHAKLNILKTFSGIPLRMLLFGLPGALLLGFVFAMWFFPQLLLVEAALLATILAPTDAALGQAVLKNEAVPNHIRQGLNAESGLNDGICVPILFVFLAISSGASAESGGFVLTLIYLVEEIGIGLLVGIVLVYGSTLTLRYSLGQGGLTSTWLQIPVVALALICFTAAQYLGGSGFIAAFCGGLLFNYLNSEQHQQQEKLLNAAEGTGEIFALITWVIFGSVIVGQSINNLTVEVVLYVLASLTIVRMLPVFLSLYKSKLPFEQKLFLGWFGPRGLASIVFAVIVFEAQLPNGGTIVTVVSVTIIASIILHGISANPWAARIGRLATKVR